MVARLMAGIGFAGAAMVSKMVGLRIYGLLAGASLVMAFVWQGFSLPADQPQSFPVHFYQHVLGHLDGRSCPSYPVCSVYARQAVGEFGLFIGSWLALDRLIHEADDLHKGPWLVFEGQTRLNDSLSRNAFWLRSGPNHSKKHPGETE